MRFASRGLLALLFAAAIATVLFMYRETFLSIADKWLSNSSYSHGLLVVPISLWLVWSRRAHIAAVPWRAEWIGVPLLFAIGAAWFVARATGVLVIEQYAAMSMIPALVFAVLGRHVASAIAFPLLFLMLSVPVGSGFTPWLMRNTVDFAVAVLQLSGIPVVRDGMMLSIPGGDFEVARACSGLNYLLTGLTLGALFAYLSYTSFRKRMLFIAASVVVPILLNGLRAYLIILIAHVTDMRWGIGPEHVTFGRVLFLVTVFAMFWIGRRWRDPPPAVPASALEPDVAAGDARRVAPAAVASILAVALPPMYLGASLAHARSDAMVQASRIPLPTAADGWQGPRGEDAAWRPQYPGALAERRATFDHADGPVEVFVAVYGLGLSGGAEMIAFGNRLTPREKESVLDQRDLSVALDGGTLEVREFIVPGEHGRVVWRWYRVGDRSYVSDLQVKTAEAIAFLSGGDASDRVLMLSSPSKPDVASARARLQAFAVAHARCVRGGFELDACTP